jgi:antitoxin component of MazEF toxin-antitoxin module
MDVNLIEADKMQQVRIRERNQITLPASIALAANLRVDDLLEVRLVNGVITLELQNKAHKRLSMRDLAGIAAGTWGKTHEEIDVYIANERDSWER